ncbi:MAG TPA: hydroxymethylbilane synthase [Blastocatellia bacterium]|nr:hydroxymethylbilane synthase [Blastocatellia bacterium]
MQKIVIGSRGSKLALWQTNWVKGRLESAHPGLEVSVKIITTTGDRITDVSLPTLGAQGKGLFTKELEEEMLDGRIDIAVHSLKDLPTELPDGLHIGAISEREDVRDALVARDSAGFAQLPHGARVGTSSLRRQAQLSAARPDLRFEPVRGNVDTRLRKVESREYDAIVLASAGLRRLGHAGRITEYLSEELILPAVGQGALAIESRTDDSAVDSLIRVIEHVPTRIACEAERSFLKGLGGGCLVPIAALARVDGQDLNLKGLVASPDGAEIIRGTAGGSADDPGGVGRRFAEDLLGRGAGKLLAS